MPMVAWISRFWTQEAIGMWRNSNVSGEPKGNSIPNAYGGQNFPVWNSRGHWNMEKLHCQWGQRNRFLPSKPKPILSASLGLCTYKRIANSIATNGNFISAYFEVFKWQENVYFGQKFTWKRRVGTWMTSRTKIMSRKFERVNIITSILKVHLKYQKYPKKLKTPFFLAPGGAGTKRTIIWFKLQPQMII